MTRHEFRAALVTIALVVVVQSFVHLWVVRANGHIGSIVDLDRSNGVPDLASTPVLALATLGALVLAVKTSESRRVWAAALSAALVLVTLADVLHDGPHPSSSMGIPVLVAVAAAVSLLILLGARAAARPRWTIAVGVVLLAGSLAVSALDRPGTWFERQRGDLVRELQIVAKEGLELAGWSLAALAVWDEALTMRQSLRNRSKRASTEA